MEMTDTGNTHLRDFGTSASFLRLRDCPRGQHRRNRLLACVMTPSDILAYGGVGWQRFLRFPRDRRDITVLVGGR